MIHIYPRINGYLDFTRTVCGLASEQEYVIDPTAAGLKFWVDGVQEAAVCCLCGPHGKLTLRRSAPKFFQHPEEDVVESSEPEIVEVAEDELTDPPYPVEAEPVEPEVAPEEESDEIGNMMQLTFQALEQF